jgi:hypothetical protein
MSIAEAELQASAAAPAPVPGPLPRRIIETFTSPGEMFARFGAAPPWIGPVLIAAVITALMLAFIPKEMVVEMAREQMSAAARPGQPTPDPETAATFMRVSFVLGGLLVPIIATVIVGGLLKLVFGAMMGGEATFQQYLGVYGHSLLIMALGAIVTFPIIMMSGDMTRQLTPALLIPDPDPASFLFKFLMQFGVFSLWQYGVIGVGVGAVNRGKLSAASLWGGIAGLYLATALISSLPALLQRG